MDEVDDRLDAEVEEPTDGPVGEIPVPTIGRRLDAVPRHPVAGGRNAELGDQPKILRPAIVVPGELVFIERPAGEVPGLGDEGVLDAGCPPERVGVAQAPELRSFRESLPLHSAPRERRLLGRRGSAHGQDASAAADFITRAGEVSASAGSASLMRRKVASAWPTI